VVPEAFPEPEPAAAPDWVPDDLVAVYGSDAKKRVRRRRSRRQKVRRQARQLVRTTNAEVMQTTVLVFLFGVIGACGLGGVIYLVYLWPKIGMSLAGGILVLFTVSYLMARRMVGRRAETEHETSLF
jgi:hypothetical protein